jgi:riboflavin kinase/FMN adenylyltransferase
MKMKIIEDISQLNTIPPKCVLSIGNFDGVHLGHHKILNVAKKAAKERNTSAVAMTFYPHPVAVLYPEKAPGVLTPLEMKKLLLQDLGIDYLIVLKDNPELLSLSAQQFVDQLLMKDISPAALVEGDDFNFGAKRSGNIETLKSLAEERNFDVLVVPPEQAKLKTGQLVKISSTLVRYMLESGHVSDAAYVLGKPYRLVETIVSGRGKGKHLGYPTLNLKIPKQIIPAEGVYAGTVELQDSFESACKANEKIPAIFSIGQARTYGPDHPLLIEAHLLIEKVSEDITEKWMSMAFIEHIRPQYKFKNEDELAAQIEKDCKAAKDILPAKDN